MALATIPAGDLSIKSPTPHLEVCPTLLGILTWWTGMCSHHSSFMTKRKVFQWKEWNSDSCSNMYLVDGIPPILLLHCWPELPHGPFHKLELEVISYKHRS